MKRLRWATALVSLAGLLVTTLAFATTLRWTSAQFVSLPAGGVGFYQGQFSSLGCTSAGNCVASGSYQTKSGSIRTVVDSEVNGTWRSAHALAAPTDASATSSVTVYGASCGAPGSCVLVGSYQDANGNVQAMAADTKANVWSPALKVTLPANAPVRESDALLRSINCSNAGNCSAVGTYADATPGYARAHAMTASEVSGTWQRATELTLPSDANANSFASLSQISCVRAGDCVAVGSYIDHDGVTRALVVTQVNNLWRGAQSLALPGNASAYAGATLTGVACSPAGGCTATGTYNSNAGQVEGLAASFVNATWQRGVELAMPANALVDPQVFLYGFSDVACSAPGNCATGGQYRDRQGLYQGFVDSEVNGVWRRASEVVLPGGAPQAGKNGGVVALSCPANGTCRAGAAYDDANSNYQALTITQTNGRWNAGQKVTLPKGATSVGVAGGLYGLQCSTQTTCSAIGSYIDGSANYQGFTLTSP